MLARQAPAMALFGSRNQNRLTFAVSDALNTVSLSTSVREEDARNYSAVEFFAERHPRLRRYEVTVRLDRRPVAFYTALSSVAAWWAAQPGYAPAAVPEAARQPMYSTWYSYHQDVSSAVLLDEVKLARQHGFSAIIVDDGWQTLDGNRGYAYTGDWTPERMPDMRAFVQAAHAYLQRLAWKGSSDP